MIPTWAVIPSAGRNTLHDCIDSVCDQVDGVIVVANSGYDGSDLTGVHVVGDNSTDRNISRWWNLGLWSVAAHMEVRQWNTLVLNDDATLGPDAVQMLTSALRVGTTALAFPGHVDKTLTSPSMDRIAGWCFMVRGENRLKVDESMAWWYGDNDLDWTARSRGGSRMVPGVSVTHSDPNGYTNRHPELARQAGRDQQTFLNKWGRLPH